MVLAFRAAICLTIPRKHPQVFADVSPDDDHPYRMQNFWDWLRLRHLLAETYFSFNPAQYNALFDEELEKVIARVRAPEALEHLRGFDWTGYVSSWGLARRLP